ncbi:S-phase kinase-associated protein 2 [Chelonus insularis]|uniref:S-phase kinase-associated protein 2 n=1 Tax=Chelonus insularis TaxID=460826 RepID=UPI00158D8B4E|nr:S-phase kinase-associated protein 2 [Chelonus insularis]
MNINLEENTRFSNQITQHSIQHWSPKSKRIKVNSDYKNQLNDTTKNGTLDENIWPYHGDLNFVEPDVMVDLGVGMLEDGEHSCDSLIKSQTQSRSISPCISKSNEDSSNSEYISNEIVSINEKSTSEPWGLNNIVNESGYGSHMESEKFTDKQNSIDLNSQSLNDISQFCLYRRKKRGSLIEENKFNKLSDEIILMILKWLPKKWLVQSMLVCKRWCEIARDEALWNRLDLGSKVLNPGTLNHILPRGVQVLRLAQAELADPVFLTGNDALADNYHSKLQYLDLSMAVISSTSLAELLFKCKKLKKLSLEKGNLNEECCKAISENTELTVLNLTMCEGINVHGIQHLMKLTKLTTFNISWCSLDSRSISLICKLLSRSITRLNIAGCRKTITDEDVQELVTSCPNLIELDLSDCTLLTMNSIQSILNLKKLEHLSLNRCYSIPPSTYLRLAYMPSLMFLDVFGLMTEPMLKTLQTNSKGTEINKFLYSSVARPTVGVRRTSIWGLRVRD